MGQQQAIKRLTKFLAYILGHRPDEFGLVPDADGFIKIKDLLKAISEEDGWKYVRKSHIDEILYSVPNPPIEISDKYIRAKSREKLPEITLADALPKLLYIGIRRRAYPAAMDRGLFPGNVQYVVLSSDRDLAERMGKRIDQSPVMLTILVQKSLEQGVTYYTSGESIYLAKEIPPDSFTGPPLPKQKPESTKETVQEEQKPERTPGTFFIDPHDDRNRKERSRRKRQKDISRKKDRALKRKQRKGMW